MRNKKKSLLLSVIILVFIAVGFGYYLYNKPSINIQNTKGLEVGAADLYATFAKDSVTAKKNYTNKILEVSGVVTLISENQQHQPVVMLKTNTEGAAVNCTMEGPAGNIKTGNALTVRGICNGMGEGDSDLGIMGDVYLVRSYILK